MHSESDAACNAMTVAISMHWIAILSFNWHLLNDIPMLNDVTVRIKSEEIHRYVFFTLWPALMSV